MKATIEIKDGLNGISFTKNDKRLDWENMTKEEKAKVLDALSSFLELFFKSYNQQYENN